jgi:hypothetical protein
VPFPAYQDTVVLVASADCFRGAEVAQPGGATAGGVGIAESCDRTSGSHVVAGIAQLGKGATFGFVMRIRTLPPEPCCQNPAIVLPSGLVSSSLVEVLSSATVQFGWVGERLASRTVQPLYAAASVET